MPQKHRKCLPGQLIPGGELLPQFRICPGRQRDFGFEERPTPVPHRFGQPRLESGEPLGRQVRGNGRDFLELLLGVRVKDGECQIFLASEVRVQGTLLNPTASATWSVDVAT